MFNCQVGGKLLLYMLYNMVITKDSGLKREGGAGRGLKGEEDDGLIMTLCIDQEFHAFPYSI